MMILTHNTIINTDYLVSIEIKHDVLTLNWDIVLMIADKEDIVLGSYSSKQLNAAIEDMHRIYSLIYPEKFLFPTTDRPNERGAKR